MQVYNSLRIFILSLVTTLTLTFTAQADIPVVNNVMVTDVTTVSFSVIWSSSEASTADLDVFQDADGTSPVPDTVVLPHPVNDPAMASTISEAAEESGVMKVMVTGLQPDTTYYFQTITTSKSTIDTTYSPISGPFTAVTTESETVRTYQDGDDLLPFSNDIIIEPCYLDDGSTPADGSLLIATVAGGNNPITAFVGDGVDSPYALIDLNNVFSREMFENLDLEQGENLTLVNFRGIYGNSIGYHEVPEDLNLAEIKIADFGIQGGRNMISFQLEPNDPDILEVMSPIMDNVISAWAFDSDQNEWLLYAKDGLPFLNTLNSLSAYTGFYLYTADYDSFLVNGDFGTSSVSLKAGRNLVGYRSIETLPLGEAFDNIYDELISVWHFDVDTGQWIFFVKSGLPFLNTLDQVKPGEAYWVHVQNDCVW